MIGWRQREMKYLILSTELNSVDQIKHNYVCSSFKELVKTNSVQTMYIPESKNTTNDDRRLVIESIKFKLQSFDVLIVTSKEYHKLLTGSTLSDLGNYNKKKCILGNTAIYLPNMLHKSKDPKDFERLVEKVFYNLVKPEEVSIEFDCSYPETVVEIKDTLTKLKEFPYLAVDIETYSLNITGKGIYSIAFAINKTEGVSFFVEKSKEDKRAIKKALAKFFLEYEGTLIFHNANFDLTHIIFNLLMNRDITVSSREAIQSIKAKIEDTMLLAYMCVNSCTQPSKSLKELAYDYMGKYSIDVKNIENLTPSEVLKYNVYDTFATFYVYEKYKELVKVEEQEEVYQLFLKFLPDCIQMQLSGLPIDKQEVINLDQSLIQKEREYKERLLNNPIIEDTEILLAKREAEKRNKILKVKRVTWKDCIEDFNFNSPSQLAVLLYEVLELEVVNSTKKGSPATDKDTLVKLLNKTTNEEIKSILQILLDISELSKLTSYFLPAFKEAYKDKQGNHRLLGFFNLGATVSGRMSSSNINLQNLPSTGNQYSSAIKECFRSPKGWLMVGIDFDSLEDKISALLSKDPNKMDVYLNGYDGHSFRALAYFKNKMADIVLANEGTKCYEIALKNKTIQIKENELIQYKGNIYTGKELYETIKTK